MNQPQYIEIETSSYCNRQCQWCPNGTIDARKEQQLMSWTLLQQIIQELKHHNYKGWLALHNFNEPLVNPRIMKELALIRDQIPACKPSIFTNGDFLETQWVTTLATLGVVYLRVTLYPPSLPSEMLSDGENRINKWLRNRGLLELCTWEKKRVRQGPAAIGNIALMVLEVIAPDISRYNWRGGTVPLASKEDRLKPCRMSSHSASIDYLGWLKMCCNVYLEATEHAAYVIGNLKYQSFQSLWNSPKMELFRRAHLAANWSLSSICRRCNQQLPAGESEIKTVLRDPSKEPGK